MNALEQLREDVKEELDDFDAWSALQEGVIAVLDTFISQWEPVEVDAFERESGAKRRWFLPSNVPYIPGDPPRVVTILAPRTQEPTLLEAAAEVVKWREWGPELASALDALATAISKEESE